MSFGGGTTPTPAELRSRYAEIPAYSSVGELDSGRVSRSKMARVGDTLYEFRGGEDGTWNVARDLPKGTFTSAPPAAVTSGVLGIPGIGTPTPAPSPAASPAASPAGVGATGGYTPYGIYAVPPTYSGPYTAQGPGWDYQYPYIPRSMTVMPLGAGESVRTVTPLSPLLAPAPGGSTGVSGATTSTTAPGHPTGEGSGGGYWIDPGRGAWTPDMIASVAAAPNSPISWSAGSGVGGIVGRGVTALEGPEARATIGIQGTMPGSGAGGSGRTTTVGFSPTDPATAANLAARPGRSVWGGNVSLGLPSGVTGREEFAGRGVAAHSAPAPAEMTHAPGTDPSELASLGYSASEISDIVEGKSPPAFGPKADYSIATYGTVSPAVAAASAKAADWGAGAHGISSADSAFEAGYGAHAEGEFGGTSFGGEDGEDSGDIDGGSR